MMFLTRLRLGAWSFAVFISALSSFAAAAPTWTVNSLNTIGCSGSQTTFSTTVSGYTGGNEHWRTIVTVAGVRYMDEVTGPIDNGPYTWALYPSTSGGPTPGAWPMPDNSPVTVDFMFIDGLGGPTVFHRRVELSQCNGGTMISNSVLYPTVAVPTLDRAGLAVMSLLLAGLAFFVLRRRTT